MIDDSSKTKESTEVTFWKRISRLDYIFVYLALIAVYILFFASYLSGVYLSNWYSNLKQARINPWFPRILWVLTTIISYIGLYLLWYGADEYKTTRYLGITTLYLVSAFLNLAWSVSLYQAENIALATWMSGILFLFQFWLVIVIWYINPVPAIFLIPSACMYLYLVYTMIHLASINNIII